MGIDSEMVQRWLDAYSHAWAVYDPAEISALFTDDAEYRWHPWDASGDVARGRAQIVSAWLANRDEPATYVGAYRPFLVKDDVAIAVGTSSYYTDHTRETLEQVYHNLWVLRFTEDGRCRSFTEWYMEAPQPTLSQ